MARPREDLNLGRQVFAVLERGGIASQSNIDKFQRLVINRYHINLNIDPEDDIAVSRELMNFAIAFNAMRNKNILTQENFDALINRNDSGLQDGRINYGQGGGASSLIVSCINRLVAQRLLNQENFSRLVEHHGDPADILRDLLAIEPNQLTQNSFVILFADEPQAAAAANPNQFFPQPGEARAPRQAPNRGPSNEDRLNAVHFPDELIPERFVCAISFTVMDQAIRLPVTNQHCDNISILRALARKNENPFNRQPLNVAQLIAEPDLSDEIHAYTDAIVAGVQAKKEALQQENPPREDLKQDDFEKINQEAIEAAQARPQRLLR